MRRRKIDRNVEKVCIERIRILFGLARKELKNNPTRTRRYISLARKIAMRHNIKMPKDLKRKYCKKCSIYLLPGVNSRVRANPSMQAVIINCLECNNIIRYPYRRCK